VCVCVCAALSCSRVGILNGRASPIVAESSTMKTDFVTTTCGSGIDALFSYVLQPGDTITFSAASYLPHSTHEIRYDYPCPGATVAWCGASNEAHTLRNTRATPVQVYYIQSGFAGADVSFSVTWSVSTGERTHSWLGSEGDPVSPTSPQP
jgi:plastocyanin